MAPTFIFAYFQLVMSSFCPITRNNATLPTSRDEIPKPKGLRTCIRKPILTPTEGKLSHEYRMRMDQVLFTVSLGNDCRGLDFSAASLSPTGDPMLWGRWNCQATDLDLARCGDRRPARSNAKHTCVRDTAVKVPLCP